MTRAIHDRLGQADPDLVQLVVTEVLGATAAEKSATESASPATAALVENGDGTITTGRGSVLPRPSGDLPAGVCLGCVEQQTLREQNRAIVTATGHNKLGVLAALSAEIAEAGGDVQDLSQTIVADYFTLIMIVDLHQLPGTFAEMKTRIQAAADRLGIQVAMMHEDVMSALQRV